MRPFSEFLLLPATNLKNSNFPKATNALCCGIFAAFGHKLKEFKLFKGS
jgi:hypothetical protein